MPLLFLVIWTGVASAGDYPEWAYPPVPPIPVSRSPERLRVPDSTRTFTQGQIDDGYEIADWYPGEHPLMPPVVSNGAQPPVRACAMCHLPNGAGHPETAGLAGLSADYIVEQMRAFVSGARTGPKASSMVPIASGMTEQQTLESARYYAGLPPVRWTRVVEANDVPQTVLGFGAVRYRLAGGGSEPLGHRIISIPEDGLRAERRDSHSGFVSFVPIGSVDRGRQLVNAPVDGISCVSCHGAALQGAGTIPNLAGRLPLNTFRALNDIKRGNRTNASAIAMRPYVADLGDDDMIAISAYLGSLPPRR